MRTTEQLIDIARKLSATAERLPGAGLVQREYEVVEDAVLQSLHRRLRRAVSREPASAGLLAGPPDSIREEKAVAKAGRPVSDVEFYEDTPVGSPAQRLQAIFNDALEQSMEEAIDVWVHRMLDRLVPDEVRILSALSDKSSHAAISVTGTPSLTGQREVLLAGICSVTKPARIKVRHLLPAYLANLHSAGLVEFGPSDVSLELDYQVLEADGDVIRVTSGAQANGYFRVRCDRQTLRISPMGEKFWALCNP